VVEAPKHLSSLLVACEGRLVLAAPGTAAAAAAAKQAALLSRKAVFQSCTLLVTGSAGVGLTRASAPPTLSGSSSPVSSSPPSSPRSTTAAVDPRMGGTAAALLGGFGSGPLGRPLQVLAVTASHGGTAAAVTARPAAAAQQQF